jgi:pimeloyl-ACP methyl ester carboxylesterase
MSGARTSNQTSSVNGWIGELIELGEVYFLMRIPQIRLLIYFLPFFVVSGCLLHAKTAVAGTFEIGDDQLNYEVSGHGFPLILVSGGSGMDLRQWADVIPTLADKYRVITYDPRGIGESDNPTARYSDSDDLEKLLDHLQLDRVGLIGLSSAGGFVLEFAATRPERVAGIVAIAPFIPGFEFSSSMKTRIEKFNQAAQQGRQSFLDSIFADPHFIPAPINRSIRQKAREIMGENYDKGTGFDPTLQVPVDPPLIEQLNKIDAPVLLLAGELDHPEVIRRNEFLTENIHTVNARMIIKSGHTVPMENPAALLAAIAPFLNELSQ